MRVIVRSAVLLCAVSAFAFADAHDDVMEVFSKMAAALTGVVDHGEAGGARSGDVAGFMSGVSKDMLDYDTLKSNVTGLVRDAEVSSSVQALTEDVQENTYKIDLDWLLQIRNLEQDGPIVRRREVVHCELRKEKKHWKIIALKPVDFFAAPNPGK
jgi:hypothetical protein